MILSLLFTTFKEKSSDAGLLMEMETGKSLVGLSIKGTLSPFTPINPALIVCTLSIMGVWEDEFSVCGLSIQYHSAQRDHAEKERATGSTTKI